MAPDWPKTVGFIALCVAAAYSINSMAGCAQHITNSDDVKVECAKQHGTMSWGNCEFPNEKKAEK